MKGTFMLRLVIDRDTTAGALTLHNVRAVLTAGLDEEDDDTGGRVTGSDGLDVGHWEWTGA